MKYPLRPGMSASVDIYTEEEKGVTAVPIQCVTVREKEGQKSKKKETSSEGENQSAAEPEVEYDEVVFLMDADTSKMVKVVTGIQDDEYIMIKSGVKVGDKLISGPYNEVSKNLKQGEKIRIKKDKTEKKEEKNKWILGH